jgi:predicted RNase H-like HicB family nuclease
MVGLARIAVPAYAHPMNNQYTAIVKRDGDWWLGWLEEVSGVNAQERTREELMSSLQEALRDILELNRTEARQAAKGDYEEVSIAA